MREYLYHYQGQWKVEVLHVGSERKEKFNNFPYILWYMAYAVSYHAHVEHTFCRFHVSSDVNHNTRLGLLQVFFSVFKKKLFRDFQINLWHFSFLLSKNLAYHMNIVFHFNPQILYSLKRYDIIIILIIIKKNSVPSQV